MANEFQPQVAQINSAVTPQEGVADTSAVDLFVDVAKAATEATFSYTGQKELSDLKNKFEGIVQARQAGRDASTMARKARDALDITRANTPWVTKEAEKLYKETFGGGSSSGVFKATPQEEAQAKHAQLLEETRLKLGLSSTEEAQKRISLTENAKGAKAQADAQKEVREYNGDVVFANTTSQVTARSVGVMDAINRGLELGGGTLDINAKRNLNLTIDQQALQMTTELNSQVRDPQTGHLLVSKSGYDANLQAIEDWKTNSKSMVEDNTTLKVITESNQEQSAEIQALAIREMPFVSFLNSVGGQATVQAFFDIAQRPEGVAKSLLIESNPILSQMFKQQGSFNQAGLDGFKKMSMPVPTGEISAGSLTQPEALATGTMLNDPANFQFATAVIDGLGEVDTSSVSYQSMVSQNPDAANLMWSSKFKGWMTANKPKAQTALDETLVGLKKNFDVASANNQQFVTNLTLFNKPRGQALSARGDNITQEHTAAIRNVNSIFKEHPEYLKKYGSENGNPDMTANEATTLFLTGQSVVPEADKEEGFKGSGSKRTEARRKRSEKTSPSTDANVPAEELDEAERPSEATMSKEALRLQPFIDSGVTKEQMAKVWDELGFSKNAGDRRMKDIIEEAYNG